ncbi:hypothetical protein PMG11_04383 [Penicillium brasilianum]|uniref:Prion-inhibition and propagation HeLo domain-containing protein n=1 Tax=Penicillium brasilianum TaxID=104259 RepID=A0A0F7VCK1_PENBI|nr:hypothetical protein PMG11_04383 [Penicillium brasilianum]
MAEPFGIAAGAVGIAAAFTACVDCFHYVQFGRHFGRDFQTDLLSLDCAKLRLTRWGQAVNILNDPQLGRPDVTSAEIQTVKSSLLQIKALFDDTEKISKKYTLDAKAEDDLSILSNSDMDPAVLALANRMKALASKRQQGRCISKRASWALYHRSELSELITNIISLIDNVEKLFPASRIQLELVKQEIAEIQGNNRRVLKLVEAAAQGVDDMLRTAAGEAYTGHRYLSVNIEGKAHTGDAFDNDWTSKDVGAKSHVYDGVMVKTEGKALVGNKFGGRDFWDD